MREPSEWKGLLGGQRLRPSLRDNRSDQRIGQITLSTLVSEVLAVHKIWKFENLGVFIVNPSPGRARVQAQSKSISRK